MAYYTNLFTHSQLCLPWHCSPSVIVLPTKQNLHPVLTADVTDLAKSVIKHQMKGAWITWAALITVFSAVSLFYITVRLCVPCVKARNVETRGHDGSYFHDEMYYPWAIELARNLWRSCSGSHSAGRPRSLCRRFALWRQGGNRLDAATPLLPESSSLRS